MQLKQEQEPRAKSFEDKCKRSIKPCKATIF